MPDRLSFLSEVWLAELAERVIGLSVGDDFDVSVRYVITGSPHGKVQFRVVVVDGRVAEVVVGADGHADVTATWRYPDAVGQFTGDLHPDVAYMTGRCKLAGDYARYLYGMRPLLGGAPWKDVLADLAGRSDV